MFATLLMIFISASSPARDPGGTQASFQESWCLRNYPTDPSRKAMTGSEAYVVRPDKLGDAIAMLRSVSVVPLTSKNAQNLVSGTPLASSKKHYLVRGGIYDRPGGSANSRYEQAQLARKGLLWNHRKRVLLINVQQLLDRPRKAHKMPFVVETNSKISAVEVVCETLH